MVALNVMRTEVPGNLSKSGRRTPLRWWLTGNFFPSMLMSRRSRLNTPPTRIAHRCMVSFPRLSHGTPLGNVVPRGRHGGIEPRLGNRDRAV